MRNNNLIGTGVALITPFKEDLTIDFDSLGSLIKHLLNNKIDYFVVMGTTGESATLSLDEQNQVINYVVKMVDKQIPIVLGVGGNNTVQVLDRIQAVDFSDIEAILCVCPYYNKPSQIGLIHHYGKIAELSPVDVILYNVPSRTGLNMSIETIVSLANKYSNIIGVKEASGDISQCMDLINHVPNDFMIISGDDKMTLPIILLGGVGVISVQAMAFPLIFRKMVKFALEGKFIEARKCHYDLLKTVDLFYVDGNPSGVKQALYDLGICVSNQVRLPLVKMTKKNAILLTEYIENMDNNKK